jgi:CubicO group peptidase (beta-lactamase class C family)
VLNAQLRSSTSALALVAVSVTITAGAAGVPVAAADATGETTPRIEAHVAEGLQANRVPGGALVVVDRDGEVHLRGFGVSERGGDEPITPDTPFVIGSLSKSMTALAVLQLVEDGAIGLDEPLARHLDGFSVRPTRWSEEVTIRRLLEQTSGLPPLAGEPATTWLEDVPIAETARRVSGTELVDEPGTTWRYTNANYVLLGALVEEVTGRSYADQLEERLFAPLGMTRTTARLERAQELGLRDGHRYVLGLPVAHLTYREGLVPSGLIVSTARDLGRYLQALLRGGELDGVRILSEAGVEALFTPAAPATLGPWAKQPAASYGFGWFVGGTPFGPTPAVFHPGATPDFGTTAALVPSTSSALALLVNVGPRVAVPGAAGDIDRIGAGAVSILMGSEPARDGTVADAYRLVSPVLLLLLLLCVVVAVRRPPRRPARRQVGVALMMAVASLALLVLPALGLGGWRQSWLWAPDLTASAVVAALALAVASVRRFLAPRPHRPATAEPLPTSDRPIPLATGR